MKPSRRPQKLYDEYEKHVYGAYKTIVDNINKDMLRVRDFVCPQHVYRGNFCRWISKATPHSCIFDT